MLQALALPAELTIYTVGELRAGWLDWLQAARQAQLDGALPDAACPVDAAAVDEVDAAGVQLLLALHHGLAHEQLHLRLRRPSEVLKKACSELGLDGLLIDAPDADTAAAIGAATAGGRAA